MPEPFCEAIKNIRRQVEADTEGKWSARSVLVEVEQALSSLTPSPVGELHPVSMSMFATKDDMLRHLLAERKQTAASLTSLSAEVARERVENERLRKFVETARDYAREIGDDAMYEDADAALSAPKGGEHV